MGRPDPGAVVRKLLSVGQLVGPLVGPVTWSVAGVARHFLTIEFLRGPAGRQTGGGISRRARRCLGGDYALRISGAGLLRDDGGCILLTGIDRSLHCSTERIVHFLLRHAQ